MYTNRELITLPFPAETRTRAIIFDYGYRPGRPHVVEVRDDLVRIIILSCEAARGTR